MSAGDIRTSRVEVKANEAANQQLSPKRTVGGPILHKRLAVAESPLGALDMSLFPALLFYLLPWLMHAGIGALLSAPIVCFGRKRVRWHWEDLLVLVIPFSIWVLLLYCDFAPKSLSNVLVEPAILGIVVPLATLVRVAMGARLPYSKTVASLIAAVSAVAASLYFFVPYLEE